MAVRDFSTYSLYRWRYAIGYTLIGLLLAAALAFAGLYLPGGISEQEMAAVVQSTSLSLDDPLSLAIPNLPYYALQSLIFSIFGITIFTIKLSSLLLGLASALGLIVLLRRWFKPNIAVLASLIAVSTGQFLFIAQSGTASILYVFWPIVLLLLGTQITRVAKYRFVWQLLFVAAAAISLYTPLALYALVALILTVLLHPHLRAVIRRIPNTHLALSLAVFSALTVPLVWLCVQNPSLIGSLLGIPSTWPPNLLENGLLILKQYFMFWSPSVTTILTPLFGLGSVLLITMGMYRMIRTYNTTRSYLIITWLVCLTPVLLLNPVFTSVMFVPSILLLAGGLTSLIGYWYRLFPLNPYARIAGLIPITLLVGSLIITGLARYAYTYHYNSDAATLYSKDLSLIPTGTTQLLVGVSEVDFYTAIADAYGFNLITAPKGETFTTTQLGAGSYEGYTISRITTDARMSDADRMYVYEQVQQ